MMKSDKFLKVKHPKSKAQDVLGVKSSEVQSNLSRQSAIKSLLESSAGTVDAKVTTVKTAHHLDKERFQNAFRTLMGTPR